MASRAAKTYDFVIVGAGSAGCVLADRLSEDPTCQVVLVEAGGWDRHPWLRIPLGWPHVFLNQLFDWKYFAEAEAGVAGRAIEVARGRVVGGSSSTNAMAYVRGHRADYDRWAGMGLDLWAYESVLPHFRQQESWEGGEDAFRGGAGGLSVRANRYRDDLVEAYQAAASQAGHPITTDYNGVQQEGFSRWQMTIRDGRRCSAADAFLRPALRRTNLQVVTGAQATRLLMRGTSVQGVEFARKGRREAVFGGEVLLSAGAINSPQLLLLSGIGDPAQLARHGVPVVAPLPGVGANLRDHVSVAVVHARKEAGPLRRRMRADRIAMDLAKAYLFGRGVASDLPAGVMGFLKTGPDQAVPDLQLMFNAAPFTARPYLPPFRQPYGDGFSARVACLRPGSRGSVTLRTTDPFDAPVIRQNLLSDPADLATLARGVAIARDLARRPALRDYAAAELQPGPKLSSRTDLERYIRQTAWTVHHPAGTCRMGAPDDPGAVVDQWLRVRGTRGLRVVDASVMPDMVGGNINAPVMMIADRAADLIRAGD